ncbi:MAG: tRNA uridine-5-carboxymethylaminomethyl(34) synthesis GTPase MnmE [Bacteroidetes bacterium]|nr:tRNA uridine-5-carboxymethylaminomethyl(34) synthesis GTPase MnmE [Bacteroidota bacterium]
MRENLSSWNDTIVALATPPGLGAIAVIRLSGPTAIELMSSVFTKKHLNNQASHTVHLGKIINGKEVIDEVVVTIYKAPKSYTGEEVVEISCHGAPLIQEDILQLLQANGARLAKPGEFTQRAFLNGKLDLTQAEAVADLIASNTEAARKTALYNLKGGFSSDLQVMREKLIKFSALIELELDFSQEDVAFANKKSLEILVHDLQAKTNELLLSFQLGNVIKHGVQVAIVGKPNAGKSTLLNALLNENRALVSEIPGTTRDTVEEYLNIQGVMYKLIDTAGIRHSTSDSIELMGIEKSKEKIQAADIVIALFDASTTSAAQIKDWQQELVGAHKLIFVGNKMDIAIDPSLEKEPDLKEIIFIAAKDKKNILALENALHQKVVGDGLNKEGTIVTNARHVASLKKLLFSLNDVETGLIENVTGDLLAIDINLALHFLGTITGQITNEDQLDFIFSKFCIGK